jgi:CheY-like chemotaxis protein
MPGGFAMSKILIVDNEPDAIEGLRLTLESEGHHLMTALDGWEAFEFVLGRLPDVVITDWKMPRVDGLGLCRLLRHNQPSSSLPVILLSGDEPPTDQRCQLYDAYLRKPVSVERLLTLVSSLVSKRH